MAATRIALFEGVPGNLALHTIATPVPTGAEVLVRIEACTLCGSDLHTVAGRRKVAVPTILGHEIVGRIEAFGPLAPRFDLAGKPISEGDLVAWAIVANCGACFYCQNHLPQKCTQSVKYGHEKFAQNSGLVGGLADHCLLAERTSLVKLPESLGLEVVAPVGCATATIAAAMEAAGACEGETVVVVGAGLLGLTACAAAHSAGARAVVCVEVSVERRRRALQFGAHHAVAPAESVDLIQQVTGGLGADLVIELSGSTRAFETIWPTLRIGSRAILVGAVFPDSPFALPLEQVVRRHLTIRGIHNYAPRHLLAAVQFLSQHYQQFPFSELVAGWYPLDQVADAFRAAHEPTAIRVGVRPALAVSS